MTKFALLGVEREWPKRRHVQVSRHEAHWLTWCPCCRQVGWWGDWQDAMGDARAHANICREAA